MKIIQLNLKQAVGFQQKSAKKEGSVDTLLSSVSYFANKSSFSPYTGTKVF